MGGGSSPFVNQLRENFVYAETTSRRTGIYRACFAAFDSTGRASACGGVYRASLALDDLSNCLIGSNRGASAALDERKLFVGPDSLSACARLGLERAIHLRGDAGKVFARTDRRPDHALMSTPHAGFVRQSLKGFVASLRREYVGFDAISLICCEEQSGTGKIRNVVTSCGRRMENGQSTLMQPSKN
jgi:hypothetical protein